jgi:hypothetical protein
MALRYLKEYQRAMGPNLKPADKAAEYLAVAQKAYEVEEKVQKRKKDKEEKDRLKKAQPAAPAAAEPATPEATTPGGTP